MPYEAFREPELEGDDAAPAQSAAEPESYLPRWFRWTLSGVIALALMPVVLPILLLVLVVAWPIALAAIPVATYGLRGDIRGRLAARNFRRYQHPHMRDAWMQPHRQPA